MRNPVQTYVSKWGRLAFACFLSAAVLLTIPGLEAKASTVYLDRGMGGLNGRLVALLHTVQRHFGRKVIVVSGCRSKNHNRKIGGARESYHLRCMAADIVVPGVSRGNLARYLIRLPGRGGFGTYCRAAYLHIDVGPKREWHWGCGRRHHKRTTRIAKK